MLQVSANQILGCGSSFVIHLLRSFCRRTDTTAPDVPVVRDLLNAKCVFKSTLITPIQSPASYREGRRSDQVKAPWKNLIQRQYLKLTVEIWAYVLYFRWLSGVE